MCVFPSEKVYASEEKLDRLLLRVPLSHFLEGPKTSELLAGPKGFNYTNNATLPSGCFKYSKKCDLCKNYFRESKMCRSSSTERFCNQILDNMLTVNLKM